MRFAVAIFFALLVAGLGNIHYTTSQYWTDRSHPSRTVIHAAATAVLLSAVFGLVLWLTS